METVVILLALLSCIGIITATRGGKETEAKGQDTGKCYGNGPIESDNICSQCFCRNNRKTCTRQSCSQAVPRGCNEVKVPGKCCPEIKCPDASQYGQEPELDKLKDQNDASYCTGNGPILSDNPCSSCFCRNNQKSCARINCRQAVPRGCSEVNVPGKCCPEIKCPEITPPGQNNEASNYDNQDTQVGNYDIPQDDPENSGKCFGEGEIPNVNPCNRCSCRNGRKICPAWNCPNRPSGPNCRFVKVPDQCCPEEKCEPITRKPPTTECSSGDGPIPHSNPCNKCKCRSGIKYCSRIRCPQLKIRPGCEAKKLPGECCTALICSLLTTMDSSNYAQNEDIVQMGELTGCEKDGPISTNNPCERCSCRRGSKRCTKMSCPPVQPGCYATDNPGKCCPKIECDYEPVKKS